MKNHYRFLTLLISCTMASAAPMSALCGEATTAGETAVAAETEAAEFQEPAVEERAEETEMITEETDEVTEEIIEETSNEVDVQEDGIGDTEEGAVIDGEPEEFTEEKADPEPAQPAAAEEESEEEAAPASEGYCGDELTWAYADGVLSIKGTGAMYNYDEEHQPEWLVFSEDIKELRIGKGITNFDADGFECLTRLETIYFEGSEKAWEELEKEWEDPDYIEEKGEKEVFAEVKEYFFGEEAIEDAESQEITGAPEAEESEAEETEAPDVIEEATGTGQARDRRAGAENSLQIVTEPQDASAAVGTGVSMHVEVNSTDVFFQWQWSRDGKTWKDCTSAGNDTDTFSFEMKETLNGRKYRCIVFNDSDEVLSRVATVSVAVYVPLEITGQPQSVTAAAGETVNIHVVASKADAAYRWQWSRDGKSWSNCTSAGYNTDTFSFTMKETLNGRKYRCIVTSGDEQVTSEEAVVTFAADEALTITEQPQNAEAAVGDDVSVHVEANKPDAAYKWQWSRDGKTWKDCTSAGCNTDTFSFMMKDTLNGRKYRCVVTSGDEQVTSDAAVIILKEDELEITKQPENAEAGNGETVNFHVEANKADVTYQWQWSADGKTWKNCSSAGYNTDTMHFVMRSTYNGRQYRCIVTSGDEQVTTDMAAVTYREGLRITGQPESVSASTGEQVNFHVTVNRTDVAYKWQWSADGNTWKNCSSSGYNTDTMHFAMRDTYDGRQYRCVVTSGTEQATSAAAAVTFEEELAITVQPGDAAAGDGATVNFHVEANRTGVTYQWQWSTDGNTWKNCSSAGYNTDTMHFVMREAYDGRQYRCRITKGTETVSSIAALLTYEKPEIVIDGVVYELIDDVMTVTGYRGSSDTVVVQETVDGHTVTVIGESAFEGSAIKSIDLPDTIRVIKKRAFADCNNLTKME